MIAVEKLCLSLPVRRGWFATRHQPFLHDIGFEIRAGDILALAGESGAGKSLLAATLLGLNPDGARVSGQIILDGAIVTMQALRAARGRRIALAPQSLAWLDPTAMIGQQLRWAARRMRLARPAIEPAIMRSLSRLGLPDPVLRLYPHQLSGGMARRVLLAIAMIGDPALLIADEPTSGVDDGNRRHLQQDLQRLAETGCAILLITHDLRFAVESAARVMLMQQGRCIAIEDASRFMSGTLLHPYARALWQALPENGFLADA